MPQNIFSKPIDAALKALDENQPTSGFDQTTDRLRSICDQIEEALSKSAQRGIVTPKAVVVSLQPGFLANMGQQLNVVVEIPRRQYKDTLFRAYVPPQGLPVQMDFYGEEAQTAGSFEEMEQAIAAFLGNPEVKNRLAIYRSLATK